MTDDSLAAAAIKRARFEVGLRRALYGDDARYESMVRRVAENIIRRGEDWRSWAGTVEEAQ